MVLSRVGVERNPVEGLVMSGRGVESLSRPRCSRAAAWVRDEEPHVLNERAARSSVAGGSGRWARSVNPARSWAASWVAEAVDAVKAVVG